ncbi:MAG: nuclear transport factor 2 family protein [Pyrinomonadaceae bacterium]
MTLLIIALMLLAVTVAPGQQANDIESGRSPAESRNKDLLEIERLEFEWNRINEISDPDGKARLLADDSYHVGPSGRIYTRAQDIEAARATQEQNKSSGSTLKFNITNKRIRLYKDIAVVTATGNSVRSTQDGQTRKGNPFRVVHVWEKRDGRWILVIDQVTRIGN